MTKSSSISQSLDTPSKTGNAKKSYWPAPSWPRGKISRLESTVSLPGSKSQTNRALVLAAIAIKPVTIKNPLASRDSVLACQALSQLGVSFSFSEKAHQSGFSLLEVTPVQQVRNSGTIDCGLAGTVMRFLPALAAFGQGTVTFTGDDGAKERPIAQLLQAISQLGAQVNYVEQPDFLPFTVTGIGNRVEENDFPSVVRVDSSQSSQFLSALLLASPLAPRPFAIHLEGQIPSAPHIEMTIRMLADQGVPVNQRSSAEYLVSPGRPNGNPISIEPDLSNAGAFLCAALICRGRVTVADWPAQTTQAGAAWTTILPHFGATTALTSQGLTITGSKASCWGGVNLDLHAVGELVPTVAALCLLADSPSELTGIGHLRGHETDRLHALATEIKRCGGDAEILPDGLRIIPGPLHSADFDSYHDHRMAVFGTLIGLAVPGCRVDNIETTQKTLPDFPQRWQAMIDGQPTPAIPTLDELLGQKIPSNHSQSGGDHG